MKMFRYYNTLIPIPIKLSHLKLITNPSGFYNY